VSLRRREQRWPYLLTDHVFDKVRMLDMALAEFEQLINIGEGYRGGGARGGAD
jgi:hypothetical protein